MSIELWSKTGVGKATCDFMMPNRVMRMERVPMENFMTSGFHHITMVARDAQRTVDFYRDRLGIPIVKRTVNFDDPDTYHLYFGHESGAPGTILTFFEWPTRPVAGWASVESITWLSRSRRSRPNSCGNAG